MRNYPTDWSKRLKRSQFARYESSGTSGSSKSSKSIDWGHHDQDDPDGYMKTELYLQSFAFTNLCQFNSIQFNSTHFHELLVNSETFKLSLNLSPTHLKAQSACYELKGNLSPLILNEIFHHSLKISKFTRICEENHSKVVFLIQILLIFDDRCNRCFWDTRLKMYRLPNFNLLLQLMVTKFFKSELFSCLSKVDHVIT